MSAELIDVIHLFNALLGDIDVPGAVVESDLDVSSFDDVPLITHNATLAHNRNGDGLWSCTLNVNVFIEDSLPAFQTVQQIYAGIHSWDHPEAGIVPGIGTVERVEQDIQAFTRLGQAVTLFAKPVTQYVGSFELSIRNA